MDLPYSILRRKHRRLFHNPSVDPLLLATIFDDPEAVAASIIHILQDNAAGWRAMFLKRS
jgi:hypothetical protein